MPSVRYILLKQADERGFSFYTDIRSPKGRQMAQNPRAAMVFYWPRKGRQVRIDGSVERMTADEADEYWVTRPIASRIFGQRLAAERSAEKPQELVARVAKLRRELRGKDASAAELLARTPGGAESDRILGASSLPIASPRIVLAQRRAMAQDTAPALKTASKRNSPASKRSSFSIIPAEK